AFVPGLTQEPIEPRHFRPEGRSTGRGQSVVPPPAVVGVAPIGFLDEAEGDQPGDGGVQSARAKPPTATELNVAEDAISVEVAVRQGEQDVELLKRKGVSGGGLAHGDASEQDVSTLDAVLPWSVGLPAVERPYNAAPPW